MTESAKVMLEQTIQNINISLSKKVFTTHNKNDASSFQQQSIIPITDQMISNAITQCYKNDSHIPPLKVLIRLIEVKGKKALDLLPSFLIEFLKNEMKSSSSLLYSSIFLNNNNNDQGNESESDQSYDRCESDEEISTTSTSDDENDENGGDDDEAATINLCVARLWQWLSTHGKRELFKTKSNEKVYKTISTFCKVSTNSKNITNENYIKKEISKLILERNNILSSSSSIIEKDISNLEKSLIIHMDSFQKMCLISRKRIFKYYKRSCLKSNILIDIIPLTNSSIKIIAKQNNIFLYSPYNTLNWFNKKNEIINQLNESIQYISEIMIKPIGFTMYKIKSKFLNRFIGKNGNNIKLFQEQVEFYLKNTFDKQNETIQEDKNKNVNDDVNEVVNINYTTSISILDIPGIISEKMVTVGIWITDDVLNHDIILKYINSSFYNRKNISCYLNILLKQRIKNFEYESSFSSSYEHTCRLPHLIELTSYSNLSDKERARNNRYYHEKNRWKKMRILKVRKPLEKKNSFISNSNKSILSLSKKNKKNSDLWPKNPQLNTEVNDDSLHLNNILFNDDYIKTGDLKEQEMKYINENKKLIIFKKKIQNDFKNERKKQFLATKSAKKALQHQKSITLKEKRVKKTQNHGKLAL
jgi:hypothetical protein